MNWDRLICSFFGAGRLPKAPGTWGSLAALPLVWLLAWAGGPWLLGGAMVVLFAVGWWASARVVAEDGEEDPSWVVIDEVVGQGLTLLLTPPGLVGYAAGFALFRLFDIKKPWPVSWADEKVKGGLGIMLDDVVAAVYAAALLALLQRAGLP
jgi:phosphatidylglycerophosphatase A